jgi:hypothetical protein
LFEYNFRFLNIKLLKDLLLAGSNNCVQIYNRKSDENFSEFGRCVYLPPKEYTNSETERIIESKPYTNTKFIIKSSMNDLYFLDCYMPFSNDIIIKIDESIFKLV